MKKKQENNFSREHIAYLKKQKQKKIIIHVCRCLILALIIGFWELFAQLKVVDPFITSSPSRVIKTIGELYNNGTLFRHIGITLMETFAGFAIAVILGYTIAVVLWSSDAVRKVSEPYIVVLNSLPKIALGPLIIIWIGTGYDAIIFMTVIVSIIVCIMNMLAGFVAVDKTKLLLMKSMGASRATTLRKLIIPASLPALMNTLKVAVGLAWIGSIMGEYIVSKAGLGYLIVYGGQVFKLDLVMTATFILCALAGGMYGIIALIEKYVVRQY
ncbi:MAG: ABC transporter permease [Clostridia bacterium]|jgi:NitT/TauT family transport system permease protein|nr:ABC transporter permease [Clostridia bacterium]